MDREVKTLLLCKVTSTKMDTSANDNDDSFKSHPDVYKDIYLPRDNDNKPIGSRYITLGGFDAMAVYSTPKAEGNQWLQSALKDKEKIIENIDQSRSYHPIHLVRYVDKVSENHANDTRFLLVTFVYGILNNFMDVEKRDGDWVINSANDGRNSFAKCQTRDNISDTDTTVEVYRCINISDRVILTYTSNISSALEAIYHLETDKMARKTYTTINFLMDDSTGKVADTTLTKINMLQDIFGVSIQGSIRNASNWKSTRDVIKGKITDPLYCVNFGEADFAISAKVTGAQLKSLLEYYMNKSVDISNACWDIHTELQWLPGNSTFEEYSIDPDDIGPPSVLGNVESDFRSVFSQLEDCDWKYSLKELISAQNNIDRNPLLHGPSYLLWDCFHIMNEYFANNVEDITDYKQMLSGSREGIERFIRCLSQLTDQLTRNDDIIFRGLGRIPAIATTLPENLLEFYHAFLRKLADFLIKIDKVDNSYEYGFLIAPELNQRARICQVFNTEFRYQVKMEHFRSWPSKQIHIIQLPIGDIFNPVQCLIPLAHECFHFFGDQLRMRGKRAIYITLFLAETYAEQVFAALPKSGNKKIKIEFVKKAREILGAGYGKTSGIDKDFREAAESKLYLSKLEETLLNRYLYLMSDEGTSDLYAKLNTSSNSVAFLYYLDMVKVRKANVNSFLSERTKIINPVELTGRKIISICIYYFRECYADFMTISVLGLDPEEYLKAFNNELYRANLEDTDSARRLDKETGLVTICQRIAIVLAAWTEVDKKRENEIICAIQNMVDGKKIKDQKPQNILSTCYNALINPQNTPLQPRGTENGLEGVFPVASLKIVVDYLYDAYKNLVKETNLDNRDILWLHNNFRDLIRAEKMFEPVEGIVEENRREVKNGRPK